MPIKDFSAWLYRTPVSQFMHEQSWVVPTVQCVHIISIAVLIGAAIVLDLRLAGVVAKEESPAAIYRRYMPSLWCALATLFVSGLVLTIAEPDRELLNWVFWTKMALVAAAFAGTFLIRKIMLRDRMGHDEARLWSTPIGHKALGLMSLAIWGAVIFCGRWIAYAIAQA